MRKSSDPGTDRCGTICNFFTTGIMTIDQYILFPVTKILAIPLAITVLNSYIIFMSLIFAFCKAC